MNALEIQTLACGAYGWFQRALIRLCVCAAAALILRTQTVRDAAAWIAALWREASYWMRLVAMSLVFGFVIHAGTKTNFPPPGMMMPLPPPLPQSVARQITEQEIAQGWRLESVTTNDAVSYEMPTNGVEYMPWSRGRGAHFALDLGGFCFPFGTGTVAATFTPAGGGETLTDSVTFRCVEPLRKLVTTEKADGRYVNPSRLVMGTNAVLKVGASGPFSPSEVDWRVVSGPARIVATNGWCATVEPTGMGTTATVEARFNGDEIQPRFVLPVVMPRTIPVRAFIKEDLP